MKDNDHRNSNNSNKMKNNQNLNNNVEENSSGFRSSKIVERKLPLPSSLRSSRNANLSRNDHSSISKRRGFPSLKNRPIGSFVPRKQGDRGVKERNIKNGDHGALCNESDGSNDNRFSQSNQLNADHVLSGITVGEYKDAMQEIQSVLSPKSIAWLKERGTKKKLQERNQEKNVNNNCNNQNSLVESNNTMNEMISRTPSLANSVEDVVDDVVAEEHSAITVEAGSKDFLLHYAEANDSKIQLSEIASLLRSTLPRQRLAAAKILFESYIPQYNGLNVNGMIEIATFLLPSALRSNLDFLNMRKLSNSTNNLICTYCIRSLDALVMILSDSLEYDANYANSAYFMEDKYLSISALMKKKPLNRLNDIDISSPTIETGVNSSKSVQDDGKAFYDDPIWVLLTRFKIIPCFANIVLANKDFRRSQSRTLLLPECIISICRILTYAATRSVTAASVISNHEMMSELIYCALEHPIESNDLNSLFGPKVMVNALLKLMINLAQQSRSAANSKYFHSAMEYILVLLSIKQPSSQQTKTTRSLAIIFWRILLRYGLAIPYLPTFNTLATTSLSTILPSDEAATPEFLSSFALVCDHVNTILTIANIRFQKENTKHVSFDENCKNDSSYFGIRLTEEQSDTLRMAGVWFTTFVQHSLQFLMEIKR